MKLVAMIAIIASPVLAVNYIKESIFSPEFSLLPGAIIVESGPMGNTTEQQGNVTFVSRTVTNTEIVDTFEVMAGGDTVGNATRTISTHADLAGMGGTPYLEAKFEVMLAPPAPAGMEYLTSTSPDDLKIKSLQLVFTDASADSNVSEVYTSETGLVWKIIPGPRYLPSFSRMEQGGIIDSPTSRFILTLLPFSATKLEIAMYARIPVGSGLINLYDPEIYILPATEPEEPVDPEDPEDPEEPEDPEDPENPAEEEPAAFYAPLKSQRIPAIAA